MQRWQRGASEGHRRSLDTRDHRRATGARIRHLPAFRREYALRSDPRVDARSHARAVQDGSSAARFDHLRRLQPLWPPSQPRHCQAQYEGQIDFFAVYCAETTGVYLIPIADVQTRTSAYLRVDPPRNNQHRHIRFAADYEIGRIAIEGLRVSSGA